MMIMYLTLMWLGLTCITNLLWFLNKYILYTLKGKSQPKQSNLRCYAAFWNNVAVIGSLIEIGLCCNILSLLVFLFLRVHLVICEDYATDSTQQEIKIWTLPWLGFYLGLSFP